MKICHLTSVHKSTDIRVFTKQCSSLAKAGCDVTLIADNSHDEIRHGIKIRSLKKRPSPFGRIVFNVSSLLFFCIKEKFDIYHAHDPELIPVLFILHILGRNVVYDMHENFPKQLESKKLSPYKIKIIRFIWPKIERLVLSRICVVFAEESYKVDYPYVRKHIDVLNMPLVDELKELQTANKHELFSIGYVGGVSEDRYCLKILDTLLKLQNKGINIRFECIGSIDTHIKKDIDDCLLLLKNTYFYGELPPQHAWRKIAKCHVGIAVLMPAPNYIESYPTKMFEYIAMGLPVITSNFKLYKSIIEDNNIGICIDPTDDIAFEKALITMLNEKIRLLKMQKQTKYFFHNNYSWDKEFEKLYTFYGEILSE